MSQSAESAFPLATELVVATFSPDGAVRSRNPAWLSLFGHEQEAWSQLSEEDRSLMQRSLIEASAGNLVTNQVIFVQVPNRDQPVPVLLHFIPVVSDASSEPTVLAVTVTGEVLAEPGTFILSQTRRHRLENIGRMTLGLVHEFNNVLTAIQGNFEVLEQSGLMPADRPELYETLKTIQRAAHDGAVITKSTNSYIRNENVTLTEQVDLPELIQECVSMTRPYWHNEPRRHGITINTKFDLQPVPSILGSTVELREVYVNLIMNAVQAMPLGGTLHFQTRYDKKVGVITRITDTGHGMTEQVKRRIFEPLFTTKGKQGTGIGLAIAYSIIENHHASIAVDTVLGEGTSFTITYKPAAETVKTIVQEAPAVENKLMRILAVDDEPAVRNMLRNLMRLKGHAIEVAGSGDEALTYLSDNKVDLVITDHGMAGMNGRQLAQRIKDRFPSMPVVLLTGDTDIGEPDDTIDAIVGKPFQLDNLQRVINELG
ncbi:MAG: response regulator [Rhodothermales bacterium]